MTIKNYERQRTAERKGGGAKRENKTNDKKEGKSMLKIFIVAVEYLNRR